MELSGDLNSELEGILSTSNETEEVLKYLQNYLRHSFFCRCIKWFVLLSLVIASFCLSIYYIPIVNWNASAIGRLALIKLILPFYDWKYLYNSRCFIESFPFEKPTEAGFYENDEETNIDECTICEGLGNFNTILLNNVIIITMSTKLNLVDYFFFICCYISVGIDRISNATYGELQSVYFSRDLPVIISDSHDAWPNQNDGPENFIEFLQGLPKLRYSVPCNILTNLLQIRRDAPNLQRLLKQSIEIGSTEWFLQFRNCEFEAVKASRAIFPLKYRPYYISNHLPPFHTSWLLISNHYEMANENRLPVKDLVFVFQLQGHVIGHLSAMKKCREFCEDQKFELHAGEALIFNAEMWNFYYRNTITELHSKSTITFIQEIQTD